MWMTISQPGDAETDSTVLWPSDRKEFKAGTLTFTSATPQEGAECKNINYDPLVMSDGIAPTELTPIAGDARAHLVELSLAVRFEQCSRLGCLSVTSSC
jgi:catalase